MIRRPLDRWMTAIALVSCLALPGVADAQEPEPPFMQHLFPPELVMQHQSAIGLGTSQRESISKEIRTVQADVLEIQWQMHDAVQKLESAVEGDRADAESALAAAERIFTLESQVKLRHLRLLLFLKEALTPEQREQLRSLRAGSGR